MGLIKKLFGREGSSAPGAGATQFHESEPTTEQGGSKNAPRREMVQVVLRDTMRMHGIPSDWIECRILSVMGRSTMAGMHVHLVVRKGDDRLLTYVHAFQNSFRSEIERFDPNAPDWLLSVAWQFEGNDGQHAAMPSPASWAGAPAQEPALKEPLQQEPAPQEPLQQEPEPQAFTPQEPKPQAPTPPHASPQDENLQDDEDLSEDLAALYAIRDAALSGVAPDSNPDHADFQPTQPGEDGEGDEGDEVKGPAAPGPR